MTDKAKHTKQYTFRLPDRVINRLDEIVENEGFRSRTEAVITLIELEYKTIKRDEK